MGSETAKWMILASAILAIAITAFLKLTGEDVQPSEIMVSQEGFSPGYVEEAEAWDQRLKDGCRLIGDAWVCPVDEKWKEGSADGSGSGDGSGAAGPVLWPEPQPRSSGSRVRPRYDLTEGL